MGSITSSTVLTVASPTSISALISIFNRLPCLTTTLQTPFFISLLSYLSAHPNLLSTTPNYELVKLINRIQSPDSFSQIKPSVPPLIINRFDKHSQPQLPPTVNNLNSFSKTNPVIELCPPINVNDTTIFTIYKDSKQYDFDKNTTEKSNIPTNLIPTLTLPKQSKGADVYIIPKNNKESSIE
jgi:hypothetical protein